MTLQNEIQKNFPMIEKLFTQRELFEFKETNETNLYLYHFGFGTWIRNNLLNEDDILYNLFFKNGILYKDEMSLIIINYFHQFVLQKFNQLSNYTSPTSTATVS